MMRQEVIKHQGADVRPGGSFRPFDGDDYTVTYVGIREVPGGEELVLRDRLGEFVRPIAPFPDNIIPSEN